MTITGGDKKKARKSTNAGGLRHRAEEILRKTRTDIAAMATEDVQTLVHELQVYQMELELQNEELHRTQVELQQARDRYAELYDHAPVGYLTLDRNSGIEEANLTVATLLKVERRDLIGQPLARFFDAVSSDAIHLHLRAAFATLTKQSCELPCAASDGSTFHAQLESCVALSADLPRCHTMLSDITDRKWAEGEQKRLELLERGRSQILERIAHGDSLSDVLLSLTEIIEELLPGLKCSVLVLDQATKCLRHGAAPSLPQFFNDVVDGLPIGPDVGSCGTAAHTGQRVVVADVMSHPDWAKYTELAQQAGFRACWSEPVLSLDGKVLGTFAMYYREPREPTATELGVIEIAAQLAGIAIEHRQTQDALIELNESLERRVAERTEQLAIANRELMRTNDELRQFAYVAAHDLQEPIRAMSGFGQMLKRKYEGQLDEAADGWIDYIVEGGERMQALVNDLLEYSRVEVRSRPFASIDLEEVLQHVLDNLKHSIDDSAAEISHDPLPTVLGDQSQLTQLFQNLVSNAVKFHDGANSRIQISAKPDNGNWLLSVRDFGIGIDPIYFDKIFDFFERLHGREQYPGTGMGLPICKQIVERHGGRIWVDSTPGEESTFFFTLPRSDSA